MKLTGNGVTFENYVSANPNQYYSTFTDDEGATIRIKTSTLCRMYELVKFDLQRRNGWEFVLEELSNIC